MNLQLSPPSWHPHGIEPIYKPLWKEGSSWDPWDSPAWMRPAWDSPKPCLNNIRSEWVAWEGIFYGSGAYLLRRGLSIEAALSHIGSYSKPNKLIGSPTWNPFWGLSWFLWINIDKFFFASPQDNPCRSRELKIVAPFQIYKVVKKTRVCRKCQGGTQYLD